MTRLRQFLFSSSFNCFHLFSGEGEGDLGKEKTNYYPFTFGQCWERIALPEKPISSLWSPLYVCVYVYVLCVYVYIELYLSGSIPIIIIIMIIHVFFLKVMIGHPMHDYYVYANASFHIFHHNPHPLYWESFFWCVLVGFVVWPHLRDEKMYT